MSLKTEEGDGAIGKCEYHSLCPFRQSNLSYSLVMRKCIEAKVCSVYLYSGQQWLKVLNTTSAMTVSG